MTRYLLRVWDRTEHRNTNRKVQDFGWPFSVKIKSGGQVEKCVQDPQVGGYLPLCICMLVVQYTGSYEVGHSSTQVSTYYSKQARHVGHTSDDIVH